MRITCPNCNAQYEIAEEMIPVEGRDVQCSNCGTTWFQEGRPRTVTAVDDRAVRRPARRPEPEVEAPPPDADAQDETALPEEVSAAETETPPVPPAKPKRAVPDEGMLEILRQERAREERLRGKPQEDRTDASEEEPDPREVAAVERARMAAAAELARARDAAGEAEAERAAARVGAEESDEPEPMIDVSDAIAATLRDAEVDGPDEDEPDDLAIIDDADREDPAVEVAAPPARTHRRELLPDIEEINSSLRPDERAAEAEAEAAAQNDAPAPAEERYGFRLGFLLVSAIVLCFVALYVFAPNISEQMPSLAGSMQDYVLWIDAKRTSLAASVEALTARIAPDS